MNTCATCRYYNARELETDEFTGEVRGQCRLRGPTFRARIRHDQALSATQGIWPTVAETAWCGQHEPKE